MSISHPFVSAVVDDNTPTGAVGPDEWNAAHTVDISFLDLNDVPATYVGQAGKPVVVAGSENGLAFGTAVAPGAENFIELGDVPASYTGEAGKVVAVNATEDGLEFTSSSTSEGSLPDLRPGSPNAMDDEFDDSSSMSGPLNGLDAKWTRRGAGSTTIAYPATSWATFYSASTSGYDQAKPAAVDYTVAMRFSMGGSVGTSNSFGGLYLLDAVNNDMYLIYILVGNNNTRVFDLEVSKIAASGSFFGGAFTVLKQLTNAEVPNALRIKYTNSSTAVDFEVSYDGGLTWVNVWSEGSDVTGHTRVGFFKTGSADANRGTLAVDWFRRTI